LGDFFILATALVEWRCGIGFVLKKGAAKWSWNEKRAENPHVSVGAFWGFMMSEQQKWS
jgi:hypothetical protein